MSSKPLFIVLVCLFAFPLWGQQKPITGIDPLNGGVRFEVKETKEEAQKREFVWGTGKLDEGQKSILTDRIVTPSTAVLTQQIGCIEDKTEAYEVITNLGITGCDSNAKDYCACIRTKGDKNILVQALLAKSAEDREQQLKQRRTAYRQKLFNVYAQINYGAAVQEGIYGIPRESQVVGCDPKIVADAVTMKMEQPDEKMAAAIRTHQGYVGDDKLPKKCKNGECDKQIQSIRAAYDKLTKGIPLNCEDRAEGVAEKLNEEVSFKGRVKNKTVELGLKAQKIARLQAMRKFFLEDYVGLASESLAYQLKTNPNESTTLCLLRNEYNFKSNFAEKDIKESVPNEVGALIKKNLEQRSDLIKKQLDDDFDSLKDEKTCVLYKDYKAIVATPSPEILESLTSSNGDYLSPDTIPNDKDIRHKFLRHNPLLATFAANRSMRQELTKRLKNFAQANKGKSPLEVQRNYAAFLQTEVPALKQLGQQSNANQCQVLGENLASIEMAKDLPPVFLKPEDGSKDRITNNYLACQPEETPAADKLELLDQNPLYMILSGVGPDAIKDGDQILGPKNDKDYDDFIKRECTDKKWDEFRENYLKERCKPNWFRNVKHCYDMHLRADKKKMRDLIQAFFDQNNPQLGEQYKVAQQTTQNPNLKTVMKVTDPAAQNYSVRNDYVNNVLPRLDHSTIASTNGVSVNGAGPSKEVVNNEKILAEADANFAATGNSTIPASSNFGRGPASVASTDGASGASENTQTEWVKEMPKQDQSVLSPATIRNASSAQDLMNKNPDLTFEERAEERQELRQQIKETRKQLAQMGGEQREVLEKKLDKFEEQIADIENKDKKEMEQKNAKMDDVPPPEYAKTQYGATPQAFAQQNVALGGGAFGAFGGGGGGSGSIGGGSGGGKIRSASSYNDAVLQMYETRKEVVTPSGLVVQDIPANPDTLTLAIKSEFRGNLNPSVAEYKSLVKTQEGLASFLFKILPQPYKEGVVQINDPEKKKKPMYVQIFKENGKFTARTYPRKYKREFIENVFSAN